MKDVCPVCKAPVRVTRKGKLARHRETVWDGEGFTRIKCKGSGS